MNRPVPPPADSVCNAIAAYPEPVRNRFLELRDIIYDCAERLDVGPLEETLKWGEPAYLTPATKAGTTLRIDWKASSPDELGIFVNCQTTLVERFRLEHADTFRFAGNRGLFISISHPPSPETLASVFGAVLTYHRNKKSRTPA